jgi:cytochrome c oxidase subunit II
LVRRGSILQLIVIGALVGGAVAAVALLIPWLPPVASKERDRIDFVFWFTTAICIAIFAVVAAVSIYAFMRFRARPDDDSDGPPIHGHTGLEVAWTAVPAVLVTAIAIVSAIVLARNGNSPRGSLKVEVVAQQFAWTFKYPDNGGVTTTSLRLPLHRAVQLDLRALDVIHSFWVPEFGQKQDAVPGIVTHLVITPTKLGTFPLICTELCGLGHALMRSQAIVMPPRRFEQWAAAAKRGITGGGAQAGKTVFVNNGCGGCHAFTPAGTKASVGPDLDNLAKDAKRAGKPVEAYTRDSIVNPDAYVVPGYRPNVMPKTFSQLPKSQIDALVQYLVGKRKKGSQ